MSLSLTTFSIKGLLVTLSINDIQHNDIKSVDQIAFD
jgi:hypothetical protein